jgi:NAD+ synthetase
VFDHEAPAAGERADDLSEVAALHEALKLGLADFVRKNDFSEAVLGLSGGIDSSLVACVAAQALGAENVTALFMPSRFSAEEAALGARAVAEKLGLRCHEMPIEQLRQAFEGALEPLFAATEEGTAEENVQARVRGTLQMAYANKFHAMPLATGNRSELAVGYCTLYGDMAGGLGVIGDIPKTIVYRLAEHLNRDGEIIPGFVLRRPPSAELRPDQRDEEDLVPYDVLDGILSLYLDEGADPEDIAERGYDRAAVWDVVSRVRDADFKRRQAPPVLRVYSPPGARPRFPLAFRGSYGSRAATGQEGE